MTSINLSPWEFKDLFAAEVANGSSLVESCTIETDLEIFIPDTYVSDIVERLKIYKRLDTMEEDKQAEELKNELIDRFGKLPKQTAELFEVVKLRRLAKRLAIERLTIKRNKLTANFVSDKESSFYSSELFGKVLHYVQCYPRLCVLQEQGERLQLVISQVSDVYTAVKTLQTMTGAE